MPGGASNTGPRAYFSVCSNTAGEILAEIAIRNRALVLKRTQDAASRNLQQLDRFMDAHRDVLDWIRPQGGMTGFPWLVSGEDSRSFCQAAAERGILFAPGDCFDVPSHFRFGFADIRKQLQYSARPPGRVCEDLVREDGDSLNRRW